MTKLFLPFFLTVTAFGYSQDFTNKGKDFWIGYGNHVRMFNPGQQEEKMQIYVTSDVNTTGNIIIPGISFNSPFIVNANQITTVDIPRSAGLLTEGKYDKGIHITAQKPVVVYSFIYVNAVSGATLCLPTSTLGREYYSINFTQVSNEDDSYAYFFAVAADTGITTLEITPTRNTLGGRIGGTPFLVNLNQGDVYQVLSANDLTGSSIRSVNTGAGCKKLAVFCGSGKISIGCSGSGTSDNLYQQMYPTSTWGKTYITVPSINTPSLSSQFNYIRIFKSEPNAIVKLNGGLIPASSFINGQFRDIMANNEPNLIESDKPILVAQYFTTQGCSGNSGLGDPEMIYLNPVEQTINKVTLNSMQPAFNTNIEEHFINVVLKNSPGATNTFRIDGSSYASSFIPHPNAPGYAYARIQLNQGTHNVTCDTPFNAISYGFGNAESYGYSAGTNLKDLYQFVSISNDYSTVNFPAGCKSSPFRFAMTFPYQPTQISWQFNGLFADTTINSPLFDSSWIVNGRTLYRYKLNKSYQINNIGTYPVSVIANNPTGDGCSGVQEIEYDLQIFERPTADFSFTNTGCISDSVVFLDDTNGEGRPIVKWYWDFDDGSVSGLRDPKHKYNLAGTFTVSHSVITDVGCLSDTVWKTFPISDPPVAKFGISGQSCEKSILTFSDSSYTPGGTISKWAWDLGDGTLINSANNNPFQHSYDTVGTYNATLQVETTSGCKSFISSKVIKINYFPKPAFGTPEVCLTDPFAQFTDSSTINDNSEHQFSYLWNFGDPNANTGNPNTSTLKEPQHKYTEVGVYNVRLTITSKDGCIKDTIRSFTVNGALPEANFTINGGTNGLCANEQVTLIEASTVDFGGVVKVEIYWDYANDPTAKTVDENPSPGKRYSYKYPGFGNPATKNYQLRYVAYSGINCINQKTSNITVKATPTVEFDDLGAVCEEILPFQITAAREIYGFSGTGTYEGKGVNSTGLFDPGLARPGVHTLRYSFDAVNGCFTFAEQTIQVYPTPVINAGPDRTVLEGGSIVLQGQGSGNNINYLWIPNVSIDNNQVSTPKVSPLDDIIYRLTVTSSDGCIAGDDVFVKVLKEPKVPNAFTPNGDAINDKWVIQYLESYPDCTVEVYNRFGQIVYTSLGYNQPWDGTLKGSPLSVATYYWIINPKNGRQQMKGSVTIIR